MNQIAATNITSPLFHSETNLLCIRLQTCVLLILNQSLIAKCYQIHFLNIYTHPITFEEPIRLSYVIDTLVFYHKGIIDGTNTRIKKKLTSQNIPIELTKVFH